MKTRIESKKETGSDLAPYADPILQQNALKQLEQALELIPSNEKAAYLEAKKECPLLIENEPGLLRFLEYDKFNVWAAARRLVTYWSIRKDLFQERAFLPMHQTGNGTLSTTELEVLSTGFVSLLPVEHSSGNLVICAIPSRLDLKNAENMISRRRCTFYIVSVIMTINNPASYYTFSRLIMLNQIGFLRTMLIKPTIAMIDKLPIYPDYGVVAHCPLDLKRKTFFEMVLPHIMKIFERSAVRLDPVSAGSRQDLAAQLVTRGYNRDSLPTECGGTWSVEKFRQWQLERIELERQRELEYFGVARGRSPPSVSVAVRGLGQRCQSANFAMANGPPSPIATMDELDKRWEWENLASARMPLSPVASLNEVEQTLEWEDPGVMSARMPSCPSATIDLDDGGAKKPPAAPAAPADTMDGDGRVATEDLKADVSPLDTYKQAERFERKRQLEIAHSKRKRARRKERFSSLQESHDECIAENACLKTESAFLERLISESKKVIERHLSENTNESGSTYLQSSVVVASSTTCQLQTGNDYGSVPASLSVSVPISTTVNRNPDIAASRNTGRLNPFPTAAVGGGAVGDGVYESSVHNQFLATHSSTFSSWIAPFSSPNSITHGVAGPNVTNNGLSLNMMQQQQQQQQQLNSFLQQQQQREAGDMINNGLLLNMMMMQQQQPVLAQSQQQQQQPLLVYPPPPFTNNALYSNNNQPSTTATTTTFHQSSPSNEEKNDNGTSTARYR